jgi:hypothetical protein
VKFTYIPLGIARFVDENDVSHPIEGNYIYGVKVASGPASGRVLGLVQENPSLKNKWTAVAATGDTFPAVDFEQGLWPMARGRGGFGSKREAAVWLLGVSDARQSWFNEEN